MVWYICSGVVPRDQGFRTVFARTHFFCYKPGDYE